MTATEFPDDPHAERIAAALWAREPVGSAALLVGAGFSKNAAPVHPAAKAMPGWNDIYQTMVEQLYPSPADSALAEGSHRGWLMQQVGATSAYLRVAEEFEAQFGRDALDKLILKYVPDRQFSPGKLHHMLVQLPWADIMTTNWDTLIERAAETAEERVYDVLRTVEEISEARAPRIIKLHGSFPSHRPFIFTEEDFRTYPSRFSPFVNLAQQLSMENTLVLLGFSGDDPNFLFWSGWVRDRLGAKAPLIYLVGVLDLTAPKRKMLESRGIQPVDLSGIPQLDDWPASRRTEYAVQWFLERLRAAEPYPLQRWPRPAAGFVPPLVHVVSRVDPNAPFKDPANTDNAAPVKALRALVVQWRQNRSVYPGWIVPPFDTSELLWRRINRSLHNIIRGLRLISEDERFDALFELNWQLEAALVPLVLTVDDLIIELLEAVAPRYRQLSAERAAQFRALALAIVRHAREENEDAIFTRWADWLDGEPDNDGEAQDRLIYERCLKHRADLEIDALDECLSAWAIQSDSYWLLRKAGLMADVGRESEAAELSSQALTAIRSQTMRGTKDIASWSRESFAMLFRASVLHGEFDRWEENEPVRDRFDLRQDQLQARGCPGRRDFFELIGRLARNPPPLKPLTETTRQFDIGSINRTHNLSGSDPRVVRLLAYQAVRFQEETGLPVRIGPVGMAGQILSEAALWLNDIAPMRAIDAFLHASPGASKKYFQQMLGRATVARLPTKDAERLVERAATLITTLRLRVRKASADPQFWMDRLKSMLEFASRIVLRAPSTAPMLLDLALRIHDDPQLRTRYGLGDEIARLIKRTLEAAETEARDAMLLDLFKQPIPHEAEGKLETYDVASQISSDYAPTQRHAAWDEVVAMTIAALEDGSKRIFATGRFSWLLGARLLTADERDQGGRSLWAASHLEHDLPGKTIFYPHAFLSLPKPDNVRPEAAVYAAIFNGGTLTDDIVAEGGLAHALTGGHVELGDVQLVDEIARLHDFIADHSPEPDWPDIMGRQRDNVVLFSARIAAGLARRVAAFPAALEPLKALVDLDRYPLRIEPVMPALVRLKVLSVEMAVDRLRALLAGTEEIDSLLFGAFIDEVTDPSNCDPEFETAMWKELGQAVAARRPGPLTRTLRFIAHIVKTEPKRLPQSLDDILSLGLALILAETEMTEPKDHLRYDPFLARFFGALLATSMDIQDRGDPAMRAAWLQAIETDPLPDTRRAHAMALRAYEAEED